MVISLGFSVWILLSIRQINMNGVWSGVLLFWLFAFYIVVEGLKNSFFSNSGSFTTEEVQSFILHGIDASFVIPAFVTLLVLPKLLTNFDSKTLWKHRYLFACFLIGAVDILLTFVVCWQCFPAFFSSA